MQARNRQIFITNKFALIPNIQQILEQEATLPTPSASSSLAPSKLSDTINTKHKHEPYFFIQFEIEYSINLFVFVPSFVVYGVCPWNRSLPFDTALAKFSLCFPFSSSIKENAGSLTSLLQTQSRDCSRWIQSFLSRTPHMHFSESAGDNSCRKSWTGLAWKRKCERGNYPISFMLLYLCLQVLPMCVNVFLGRKRRSYKMLSKFCLLNKDYRIADKQWLLLVRGLFQRMASIFGYRDILIWGRVER